MGRHGAKPHTPLLGRGKCEAAALSGVHILCEHALTGKMTVGGVCGSGRFCIPIIRVWKVKGRA